LGEAAKDLGISLAQAQAAFASIADWVKEKARNYAQIADLEREAVRITVGPAGRCFEMPDGHLLTIHNEQRDDGFLRLQQIAPLLREDAEDYYGWVPARPTDPAD
jgi:hypothetical protein